jgi:porphobilinogen synthase
LNPLTKEKHMLDLIRRPRRLRRTAALRELSAEVHLTRKALIQPFFTVENASMAGNIESLQGIARETLDTTIKTIEADMERGIRSFLLFGLPAEKDLTGLKAQDSRGIAQRTISTLKKRFGDSIVLSVDVCLCPHLEHGHCGLLTANGEVENDSSVAVLAQVARTYAEAGADIVAPSDMMDGRIGEMRAVLDDAGLSNTAIMAYSAKYASSYYGPFREAAHSSPTFGDRRAYQMDPRNGREGVAEALLDLDEGADMVMVKPALAYLDIIYRVKEQVDVPVVAYNVSGEYAAVKLLAEKGLAKETDLAMENLHAMRRAGADLIITYHARDLARANAISVG